MKRLVILFVSILAVTSFQCRKHNQPLTPLYDETLEISRKAHKKLIVLFGADWCPDCRSLNAMLLESDIADLLKQKYIVLKIDVGRFDKNLALDDKLGNPISNGIPALVIIDPEKSDLIVATTKGGEFSNASQMSKDQVFKYLKQYQ